MPHRLSLPPDGSLTVLTWVTFSQTGRRTAAGYRSPKVCGGQFAAAAVRGSTHDDEGERRKLRAG